MVFVSTMGGVYPSVTASWYLLLEVHDPLHEEYTTGSTDLCYLQTNVSS
jgi:hypothetical protein